MEAAEAAAGGFDDGVRSRRATRLNMERRATESAGYRALVRVVGEVRRRWRLRQALRGLGILAIAALATFLVAALVLERLAFAPGAIMAARVALAVLVVGLLARLLLLPLGRRVTDEQVALYLEEHEPSLGASLVGALSASRDAAVSPAFARRTIEVALARCQAVENGRRVERRSLTRYSGLLSGTLAAVVLLVVAAPPFVRDGARAIFLPLRSADAAVPFRVSVAPGDVSLPRGADLSVSALLSGFASDQVELLTRRVGDSLFQRVPMLTRPDSAGFELRLLGVSSALEYYVEAGDVRSPVFRATVLDLPYVERLELELVFPAYTGLPPRRFDDGGDIAAPAGTLVRVRALPTQPVTGGRIRLDGGRTVTLAPDDSGGLRGEFRVEEPGLYHLELQPHASAEPTVGSPEYLIEVLRDAPPTVSFAKPGRDVKVTSVDEVFVEAVAEDDYGVRSLELVFSVNGGAERTLPLYGGRPMPEVSAGHTFYLEELGLQPGDFVSYYARVSDVGPGARRPVTSDIYFLEIRPFGREYRQADAGGGGGAQGGGGDEAEADGQLSQRQRELIAATFNLVRDRERYTDREFREHLTTLALAQEKLREQTVTLARRIAARGAARDSTFQIIAATLPRAAAEMEQAVDRLRAVAPTEALPSEQRALLHLQRAEAAYREVQVSMGQQQGGGGGGGGGPSAEDLADLFGLEVDRMRNQYETVQRGERQQTQAQVDQTLDRVRELARRLEREDERLRQALANQQLRDGSSAANQRRLAEETEQAARQLERLAREQGRRDLMEAARRLNEAADAMRRGAADGRSGNASDTRAALDRLREAGRRLERNRESGVQQEAQDLARRAQRLVEEQREIGAEMERLGGADAERTERARRLVERKEEQASEVADVQRQLERSAAETRGEQPDASRRLQAAAESIRRNQLQERIRASRAGTQPGAPREYGRQMEAEIASGLGELSRLTEEASRAAARSGTGRAEESLDRTRDLVRGLESMQERTRQAASDPSPRTPGESGGQGGGRQDARPDSPQGGQQGGQSGGQQGGQPSGQQGGQSVDGQGAPGGEQGEGSFGPGGGGGGGPRGMRPDDARQLRGEIRERLQEAESLRRELAREGVDTRELDRSIAEMRALDDGRVYNDWRALQHLQAAVVERLKQFEFTLRQQVRGDETRRLFLSGSGEVPAGFREMVERYYRELPSRGPR
jgi:hypothetical protein